MHAKVVVMATLETKAAEAEYLVQHLQQHDVDTETIDLSLHCAGAALSGSEKLEAMNIAASRGLKATETALSGGVHAVIAIGGGTGSEIAMGIMRALPITFPKVLVTPMPFDPRFSIADTSIILVPTLADICGLNATLREVLENAAALTKGLCATERQANACVDDPTIGITALGATEAAIARLVRTLQTRNQESTVFHANGFGGAAFARFAQRGAFHAVIDLTPHELTRLHIAGSHVAMPTRFTAYQDRPLIVLPGGLNFIGMGEAALLPEHYRGRPHYAHSALFTHVKLSNTEMLQVSDMLVEYLNAHHAPCALIVPMGGFSHQDCSGGAIEDAQLRTIFLEQAQKRLNSRVSLVTLEEHIAAPKVTDTILSTLDSLTQ